MYPSIPYQSAPNDSKISRPFPATSAKRTQHHIPLSHSSRQMNVSDSNLLPTKSPHRLWAHFHQLHLYYLLVEQCRFFQCCSIVVWRIFPLLSLDELRTLIFLHNDPTRTRTRRKRKELNSEWKKHDEDVINNDGIWSSEWHGTMKCHINHSTSYCTCNFEICVCNLFHLRSSLNCTFAMYWYRLQRCLVYYSWETSWLSHLQLLETLVGTAGAPVAAAGVVHVLSMKRLCICFWCKWIDESQVRRWNALFSVCMCGNKEGLVAVRVITMIPVCTIIWVLISDSLESLIWSEIFFSPFPIRLTTERRVRACVRYITDSRETDGGQTG